MQSMPFEKKLYVLQTNREYRHIRKPENQQEIQNIPHSKLQKQVHNLPNGMHQMQDPIRGKCEWGMNVRTNKHRSDVLSPDGLHVCKHFNHPAHDFNRDAKITIIEELKNKNLPVLEMRKILEGREDFWIKRLKTLHPDGFNMELNNNDSDY